MLREDSKEFLSSKFQKVVYSGSDFRSWPRELTVELLQDFSQSSDPMASVSLFASQMHWVPRPPRSRSLLLCSHSLHSSFGSVPGTSGLPLLQLPITLR